MRRIIGTILGLALCALLLPSGWAAPAFGEEASNRDVTVGIFEFDGYHMQDEAGNLSGYGIEILELIERYSHLNFKMAGYDRSWGDMLEMLEDGEIDMVTTARKTPEREEKFAFSLPLGTNRTLLSTRIDNRDIVAGDYTTYDSIRVGLVADSSQNAKLAAFAQEKGFDYEAVEFEDAGLLEASLQMGELDAILSSNLRKGDNEKALDVLDESDFYAIVRKDDTALIEEINYAIEQIDLHEGDWKNVLFYRFYGPEYSSALDFTDREQAYIDQVRSGEKTITATVSPGRMPYSYVENGKITGILIDYFAAVMGVAELPYELVVPAGEAEYLEITETNGVDVVVDAIVAGPQSHVRADGYDGFETEPYMETGFTLVTKPGYEGTPQTIAVDDVQAESLVKERAPEGTEVILYPTMEGAIQAVDDGNVDAAYVYSYAAQLYINQDGSGSLHFGIVPDLSTEFVMYVRSSADHELVTILDKCIQMVPRSKLDRLIAEYTTYSLGDLSLEALIRANPLIAGLVGFIVLGIVLIIASLALRNHWSQRLLRTKEESNKELGEQFAIVDALSRDYTNVFAVNPERGLAKIIKLEGYVTEGLKKDADLDYDYRTILKNYIEARVHPEDQVELARALSLPTVRDELRYSDSYQGTYRILSDGEEHHYQYVYTPVEEDDGTTFVLAAFRNIDETIRDEQEQREILSEALAQAQYANKAKTTFLNSMSHDIRTPMNAIIGFTSLASSHVDEPEQVQDYLDKIMTSSNHLLSLINDVLDMSRIESGKVNIEEEETRLPEVLRDLNTIVQTDVKKNRIDFRLEEPEVRNAVVVCDKLRLNQVLLNILSNAMKYTKPGGMVSMTVVQTSDAQDGYADYEFRIKDTGIGMSPEFLKHVFEPFEREETATVSGIQGTGLGLAITKNIVDVMGGTITVESVEGQGSEFVVSFRFRVVDETSPLQRTEGEDAPKSEEVRFDGKHILLVEDNELNCEIAQAILEKVGFEVDTAHDGKVAVEKIAQNPAHTYDVVLSDIQMPVMDGYEETRTIRAMEDPEKANIPIVAMTANAFEEDREEAATAGMDGYVHKPINVGKLMEVLAGVLTDSPRNEM